MIFIDIIDIIFNDIYYFPTEIFHEWLYPALFRVSLPAFRCSAVSVIVYLDQSLCLTQTLPEWGALEVQMEKCISSWRAT